MKEPWLMPKLEGHHFHSLEYFQCVAYALSNCSRMWPWSNMTSLSIFINYYSWFLGLQISLGYAQLTQPRRIFWQWTVVARLCLFHRCNMMQLYNYPQTQSSLVVRSIPRISHGSGTGARSSNIYAWEFGDFHRNSHTHVVQFAFTVSCILWTSQIIWFLYHN